MHLPYRSTVDYELDAFEFLECDDLPARGLGEAEQDDRGCAWLNPAWDVAPTSPLLLPAGSWQGVPGPRDSWERQGPPEPELELGVGPLDDGATSPSAPISLSALCMRADVSAADSLATASLARARARRARPAGACAAHDKAAFHIF
eukprot:6430083-Pyramimonas_sp.AAC.1